MIQNLLNIYNSKGLNGDLFLKPLKAHNRFFVNKIQESHRLTKLAWIVAGVVSGLFGSPFFAVLGLLGMGIKMMNIPSLKYQNHKEMNRLKLEKPLVQAGCSSGEFGVDIDHWDSRSHFVKLAQFHVTPDDSDRPFDFSEKTLRDLDQKMKYVHFHIHGSVSKENPSSFISIDVGTLE